MIVMGHAEREAEPVCPNSGCGDVGDKVIVEVKCCPTITIYSELLKDQCPHTKHCCCRGALCNHKVHLPNTFHPKFWICEGCQLAVWPDVKVQLCAKLLGHEGDSGPRVQSDDKRLFLS